MIMLFHNNSHTVIDLEGAWIRELVAGNSAILYPKSELTSGSGEVKTRGGMHVCLPNFGPGGDSGLAQHGFGRTSLWSVTQQNEYSATLRLDVAELGYEGLVATLAYRLDENSLTSELSLANQSGTPLRVAPGFHPYFAVQPSEAAIAVNDRLYELDSLAGTEYMTAESVELQTTRRHITLTPENLSTWAIWTDKLGSYVCVEPTFGGNRFLDDEKSDELLAPSEIKEYSITISW